MATQAYQEVRPEVQEHLRRWKVRAQRIPSPDLRAQALASLDHKAFHSAGGSIYGVLAGDRQPEAIRFIVAYQTISDYLDNLCDRSTSLDPDDFRLLHTSMLHALTPGAAPDNYYRLREEQDDAGYLSRLVATCQEVLQDLADYDAIAPHLHDLADYYFALQVYKHVRADEREALMRAWFAEHEQSLPPMTWYEFSACSGSTLGIFALVAYACRGDCTASLARAIRDAHFPWVQGLHILLDYLIDQDEDRKGGDLNFCSYYPDRQEMMTRLSFFYRQANVSVSVLPNAAFHRLINQGLLGIYCSDPKVRAQAKVGRAARELVLQGGVPARFFYSGCRLYRRMAAGDILGGPEPARQ